MSGAGPATVDPAWWATRGFARLWELQPLTRPDLDAVRREVALLDGVADACLVTNNQRGRATVSGAAVAAAVAAAGGTPVWCLNARDRNLLGVRRDLLTAVALGVRDVLLVHGDDTPQARRSGDVTVRRMLEEARELTAAHDASAPLRVGVTARAGRPLPGWKRSADLLVVQMSFAAEPLLSWHADLGFPGPVVAGVAVLTDAGMARRMAAALPDVEVPAALVERLERDPGAGVDAALDLVAELRRDGHLAGVHVVAGGRTAQLAGRWRG